MLLALRKAREAKHLSGRAVARALGIDQAWYSRIEKGSHRPSPELAKRIADFFDNAVTRDQILFPEEYTAAPKKRTSNLPKAS